MVSRQHSSTTSDQSRRYGIREGAWHAAMQGAGENYLSAFALLLQATPLHISLLSALPQVAGMAAQLLSAHLLHRFPHRKPLIVVGSAAHALAWLPLVFLPLLLPQQGPWLLILGAVVAMAFGQFTVPPWNSLLSDLVPPDARGTYFARRARVMSALHFLTLCGAGAALQAATVQQMPTIGFVLIFCLAAAARTVSTGYLAHIHEPVIHSTEEPPLRLWDFFLHQGSRNFRRFLLFSGLMHVCVLIAGPFFVVYMLRDLHWSYSQYTAWLAAGLLGQLASYQPWGQISDRYGNKKLLAVTAFLVPILPMLYLFSASFVYLLGVNLFGGVVWAGLSLGLQNFVFDAVPAQDRVKGVAVWNTVNAVGWFLGGLSGSWLADAMPNGLRAGAFEWHWVSNLPLVFCVSGILRLIVSVSLIGTFQETRTVETISRRRLLTELPIIKPLSDALGVREERR
jgi:MFS family permease